jgi:hypothetical protein
MKDKQELPKREENDLIKFQTDKHQAELDKNLNWGDCPPEHKQVITDIIKTYWDVFAKEGLMHPIRGYKFHIDTGNSKPVCCKSREYGPHESRIINQLVETMENNGVVEGDDGPWGSRVVLAQKPDQAHKHWTEYVWRLCVSYRPLNAITRPFTFPTPRCDNAILELGPATVFITMDMMWGY